VISQRIEMDFGLNLVRTKITSWILMRLINTCSFRQFFHPNYRWSFYDVP
jgi:hypothetical protein